MRVHVAQLDATVIVEAVSGKNTFLLVNLRQKVSFFLSFFQSSSIIVIHPFSETATLKNPFSVQNT